MIMTAMALSLTDDVRYADSRVRTHLFYGYPTLNVATWVSGFLDRCGERLMNRFTVRLHADANMFRGLLVGLQDVDAAVILDAELEAARALSMLEEKMEQCVKSIRAASPKNGNDMPKTQQALSRAEAAAVELCSMINEVKWAISEHDADAQTAAGQVSAVYQADDMERILADLKK
jgi:hypothetical protein